jgi:hypothetical protein
MGLSSDGLGASPPITGVTPAPSGLSVRVPVQSPPSGVRNSQAELCAVWHERGHCRENQARYHFVGKVRCKRRACDANLSSVSQNF